MTTFQIPLDLSVSILNNNTLRKELYKLHNATDNSIILKDYYGALDTINDSRLKIHFNLTELMSITGLSIRTLKYRMKEVKKKYINIPSLLSKKRIECGHFTVIDPHVSF